MYTRLFVCFPSPHLVSEDKGNRTRTKDINALVPKQQARMPSEIFLLHDFLVEIVQLGNFVLENLLHPCRLSKIHGSK